MTYPMVGSDQVLAKHKKTEQGIGIVFLPSIQREIDFTRDGVMKKMAWRESLRSRQEHIVKDKAYDKLD